MVTAPASAPVGTAFSVTVTVRDPNNFNYIASSYTGTVQFSSSDSQVAGLPANYTFTTGTGGDNGVHTFTGLTLKTAGSQTVTATDTGTSTITGSATVTVSPATATPQLVVTTPPASVTPNTYFSLTVAYKNVSGIIDTTFNGPVKLALSGGTSGAVLGGTLTVNALKGSATFSGLTINTVGTGYTLTASSGALTSAPVTVTVADAGPSPPAIYSIPVISFHGISDKPADFPWDMPLSTFQADIDKLKAEGYHSITLQQYLDWEAGKNPVLPSKPILLTDDDGDKSITQMTQVLKDNYNNINYTMVAFIVTGAIDNDDPTDPYYLKWTDIYNSINHSDPNTLVGSGAWEIAFHAGAYGHYDYADPNDLPPGQPLETKAPYFYADVRPGETDAQYQQRVTQELDQGTAKLQQMVPTAYTNVFAVPFNDYGEYAPNTRGGQSQQDLTTIFASRFKLVFVEDNDYPNSVSGDHHQYRFEVHSNTSTDALLAAVL